MPQPAVTTEISRHRLGPTSVHERESALDVLRGLAIAGILFVNIQHLKSPYFMYPVLDKRWDGFVHDAATGAVAFLLQGKCLTLLSFLLGYGVALQFRRAELQGRKFESTYLRRLAVLFLIGAVHSVLIWDGDILATYAMLGIPLLWARRLPVATITWIGVLLIAGNVILYVTPGLIPADPPLHHANDPSSPEYAMEFARWMEVSKGRAEYAMENYQSGNWWRILEQRLLDLESTWSGWIYLAPRYMGVLLLGLAAGKVRLLRPGVARRYLLRKARHFFFWATVVLFLILAADLGPYGFSIQMRGPLGSAALEVSQITQGLFYACAVPLVLDRNGWRQVFAPFAAMGRMPLTNYLMQTTLCSALFLGGGLYGRVGPAQGVMVAAAIIAFQLLFSRLWLERRRAGPVEALWRHLTYTAGPERPANQRV